jgi:hypothetical protein
MSPRTRETLIFVKCMLDRWDISLALFCLQFGSAFWMTLTSWGWLAIPFYVLAGFDGYRFVKRFVD